MEWVILQETVTQSDCMITLFARSSSSGDVMVIDVVTRIVRGESSTDCQEVGLSWPIEHQLFDALDEKAGAQFPIFLGQAF